MCAMQLKLYDADALVAEEMPLAKLPVILPAILHANLQAALPLAKNTLPSLPS
jgi:hypothetical protein